jgi:peroxiredoxin
MKLRSLLIALLCAFVVVNCSVAAEVKTLEIGAAAPDFALPGVDGKTHKLADFQAAKLLVVLFTCNHCPTAQAYEDRVMKMHDDYKSRGVALVAISPNDPNGLRLDELGYTDVSDSFDDMKARAKEKGFQFPYLYDGENQKVSAAYGVQATPQVYVFDVDRKLRYVGRIDDSDVKEVASHDARNAIDALLAGKPVPVEKTRVFGCSTKWAAKHEEAEASLKKWDAEPVELEPIDLDGVKKLAANDSKSLRLINVWATWCGPCVRELPEFTTINRMYRKRPFEMITISLDDPAQKEAAIKELKAAHISSKNYQFGADNLDKLADALDDKWEGPLPHTVLIAPGGEVIYRHTGPIEPLELKREIVKYLGRTYAGKK